MDTKRARFPAPRTFVSWAKGKVKTKAEIRRLLADRVHDYLKSRGIPGLRSSNLLKALAALRYGLVTAVTPSDRTTARRNFERALRGLTPVSKGGRPRRREVADLPLEHAEARRELRAATEDTRNPLASRIAVACRIPFTKAPEIARLLGQKRPKYAEAAWLVLSIRHGLGRAYVRTLASEQLQNPRYLNGLEHEAYYALDSCVDLQGIRKDLAGVSFDGRSEEFVKLAERCLSLKEDLLARHVRGLDSKAPVRYYLSHMAELEDLSDLHLEFECLRRG